jgi:hypothetical protein
MQGDLIAHALERNKKFQAEDDARDKAVRTNPRSLEKMDPQKANKFVDELSPETGEHIRQASQPLEARVSELGPAIGAEVVMKLLVFLDRNKEDE